MLDHRLDGDRELLPVFLALLLFKRSLNIQESHVSYLVIEVGVHFERQKRGVRQARQIVALARLSPYSRQTGGHGPSALNKEPSNRILLMIDWWIKVHDYTNFFSLSVPLRTVAPGSH